MTSQGSRTNDESIAAVKNDILDELLQGIDLDEIMTVLPPQSILPPAENPSSLEYLNNVHQIQANPVQKDHSLLWNHSPSSVSGPSSTSLSSFPFHVRPEMDKSCEACGTRSTPEWRKGPDGRKNLCNACGLRFSRNRGKKRKQEKKEREEQIKNLLVRKMGNKAIEGKGKKIDQISKNNISRQLKQ